MASGDLGEPWRLGRRPALDGLRGVAILLVLAAHVTEGSLHNFGPVGVTVFFALSGFLITTLLLEESGTTGRLSLRGFYGRRARRLLPALVVYLAFWVALGAAGLSLFDVRGREVVGALLYSTNWLMAAGAPISHPVAITWSLSVEEQFYLLWPLVILAAVRRPRLAGTVAALGVVYAVAMRVVSWDGGGGVWSIYYRTDTRMDSLLLGCLLAVAVSRAGVVVHPVAFRRAGVFGVVLLGVVLAWDAEPVTILAVPFVASAAGCLLIAGVLAGGCRWLAWSPLRWFGRRSYALYLWHYPLVALAWAGVLPMWVAVGLGLLAAELSWWLVERPFTRRRSLVAADDPIPLLSGSGRRVGSRAAAAQ